MSKRSRVLLIVILVAVLLGAGVGAYLVTRTINRMPVEPLLTGYQHAQLVQREGHVTIKAMPYDGGDAAFIDPQTYFDAVYQQHQQRSFGAKLVMTLFNVSSLATVGWVVLGFVGQLLFAGRMLVQWIATERKRQSVIPTAFWWLALSGASMLLLYFIWRKDIIGIFGQGLGWMIYVRNLYFIYTHSGPGEDGDTSD